MVKLNDKILDLICSQGLWAFLSLILIFYVLKKQEQRDFKQEERELNYQKIIANLSSKFNILSNIKDDISEIKKKIDEF